MPHCPTERTTLATFFISFLAYIRMPILGERTPSLLDLYFASHRVSIYKPLIIRTCKGIALLMPSASINAFCFLLLPVLLFPAPAGASVPAPAGASVPAPAGASVPAPAGASVSCSCRCFCSCSCRCFCSCSCRCFCSCSCRCFCFLLLPVLLFLLLPVLLFLLLPVLLFLLLPLALLLLASPFLQLGVVFLSSIRVAQNIVCFKVGPTSFYGKILPGIYSPPSLINLFTRCVGFYAQHFII